MNYKHSCVIDSAGYYKTLVLILYETTAEGIDEEKIQYYSLQEGEALLDTCVPASFVKPQWNGSQWAEGATLDEVKEWETTHPKPIPTTPTSEQQELADIALKQAKQDMQLAQTQQICAMLMLQLAQTQARGETNV